LEALKKVYDDAEGIVTDLRGQNLVVSTNTDDNQFLKEMQEKYICGPSLETVFMLLTDACNLQCNYCFINGNMPQLPCKPKTMTWSTAKEALDMYFANLRPTRFQKTIVFYGGEPTLAFPLLKKIVGYLHSDYGEEMSKYNIGLLLITNGTKINSKISGYLAEHPEISICVSLDGCEEANDLMRIYPDGRGTFKDISNGLEELHKAGRTDINISTTIDSHNIDRLDDLLVLHEKFQFQSVNFNLLLDTANRVVDPAYTKKATERMVEYFVKAREIGLHEDRIMRKIKAISRGVLHPFDCRATAGQLAVSPDGSLGVCHEGVGCKNFFFGTVSKDFVFEKHPLIQEWGRRSPLTMPQCFDCPSLGLCGGGCAYSAFLRHGSIWAIDDKFCEHSLTVLRWLIWDTYDRM